MYGGHYQLIISMEILIIPQPMPSFLVVVASELYLGEAYGKAASVVGLESSFELSVTSRRALLLLQVLVSSIKILDSIS